MLTYGDEDRLLMIPGPTPVHRRVLAALARPTISHTSAEIAQLIRKVVEGLAWIADNETGKMFVLAGSGTLAQEIALLNFLAPDDRLLVASNGFFADRLTEIAQHHRLAVTSHQARWGASITPDQLEEAIRDSGATAVAFTHVETSTGAMAPLSEFTEVIRTAGAISIVDGVAAFAGVPEPMAKLGIDVLLTGAQKALGVPPGLAIIAVGKEAWAKRSVRKEPVGTYYGDLVRWAPIMDNPEKYFSTHAVNLLFALSESLDLIRIEGLDARFARHQTMACAFRSGMQEMGFEVFTDSQCLAPTLSVFRSPPGILSSELRRRLYQQGVVVAGGLNDASDRVVRYGHMGNISGAEIAVALSATHNSLM